MCALKVPLVIRGEVIEDADFTFKSRDGSSAFTVPDVRKYVDRIALASPSELSDLYDLNFDDVASYLSQLGNRLQRDSNSHLRDAYEMAQETSGLTANLLARIYDAMGAAYFAGAVVRQTARSVGEDYLDGWVQQQLGPSSSQRVAVRAFGARTVSITAGNTPTVAAMTILYNAVIRGDLVIKAPSNDPLTAAAIAVTAIEMAPDHPLTKHLSVAYWKGGDEEVEREIYRPDRMEKIVAWGGLASIRHIARYIQPGIDLITMDPKLSSSIVGSDAFHDGASMHEAAERLALDIGGNNQEACTNARVVYIETGTGAEGLAVANQFGAMLMDAILSLPSHISTPARKFDQVLMEELESLKLFGEYHEVFGGGSEGAVIVSQTPDPVDFASILGNRVANLVPIDTVEEAVRSVTAYTQTVGVYPDSLRRSLRDRLAHHGAQRIVSLGYATGRWANVGPHDGIEPLRRMCKWVVDEEYERAAVPLFASA
jgi:hypothetical protein